MLITFEGVEGAGKSTQIRLLRDHLEAQGRKVVLCREPGGTAAGEAIRGVLLSSSDQPLSNRAELLLFLAARAQIVDQVIRPSIEAGKIVLCDRFMDSTVAYQGYARGGDLELIYRLNLYATGGLTPHLTILLDLDPKAGLSRQTDRNRMEAESPTFHQRVRDGFRAIAQAVPDRFLVVDASRPIDDIQSVIRERVDSVIMQKAA